MANNSIYSAFERMWAHTNTTFATKQYVDNAISNAPDSGGYDDSEVRELIQANSDAIVNLDDRISNEVWGGIDSLQESVQSLDERINQLEQNMPCLIAGTQILMADGTTKNIEDLQEGDMIKSWDLDNNTYVNVKCLARIRTGVAKDWQLHVFDNDSVLTIYEAHAIYSKERGCPKPTKQWEVGNIALALDGIDTEFCGVVKRTDDYYTDRFTLITENNLYFANGILCGHHGNKKMSAYNSGYIKNVSEEELARYRAESKIYETYFNWRTNPEYLVASTKIRAKFNKADKLIEDNKKKLAQLDYKTIKRLQGELTDEEWAETVEYCNSCRNVINEKEIEKENLQNELRSVRDNLGIVHRYIPDCFKACYNIDMEYIRNQNNAN